MNIEQLCERYTMYDVESIEIKRNKEYVVTAKQKEYRLECPGCGSMDAVRRGLLPCKFRDLPFNDKEVWIHFNKIRYHCPCCDKHFIATPVTRHKNYMMTNNLHDYIKNLKGSRSARGVSKKTGVHYKTVQTIWSE